jgi:hypothetical protein
MHNLGYGHDFLNPSGGLTCREQISEAIRPVST